MKEFDKLINRLSSKANPANYFSKIINQYTGTNRHYHNLQHVIHCLDEFKHVKHLVDCKDALELAIWYHDFIYYTKTFDDKKNPIIVQDNEEKSAIFAYEVAKELRMQDDFAQKVHDLIILTKNHFIVPKTIDEQVMLDADLSILGQPKDIYDAYEQAIRREYAWVPIDIFRKKRGIILQKFLNKSRESSIYSTGYFCKKYESLAVENIERALFNLSLNSAFKSKD
ncbi:hypothetical protein COV11_01755 [Candidatus Woesearchaeota archaeon CG10_big_fil_rev_8_21_14_0_10_30_7]|nr:MAG: hypothetical protein COV11_01755 [Candidatus Woesearchaeota archaeon CG10_big_fil_rev_8_21_14_0_10_30_7]